VYAKAYKSILVEACTLEKARRLQFSVRSGVHALHSLIRAPHQNAYGQKSSQRHTVHALLRPLDVDEPRDSLVVDMLQALPSEEAAYYSCESNLIEFAGKSSVVFQDLEERFVFVNGSERDYALYLNRADLPQDMWEFELCDSIQAFVGLSFVPKKNTLQLRKLLMAVPANYMWADPRTRANHGLNGGGSHISSHSF
jgi:hypothetical protein